MFWLAAVRDAFSNRIVGWKAGDRCDTDLILGAVEYGIWSRDVRDQQLIHHSDRGSNGTLLVITGPARGRLINLDDEGAGRSVCGRGRRLPRQV